MVYWEWKMLKWYNDSITSNHIEEEMGLMTLMQCVQMLRGW